MNPTLAPPTAVALIAEDEPLLAQALAAELRHAWPGLTLQPVAEDGEAAIERALSECPDLLFLDIRMPVCSGLEAAQAIVEDWPDDRPLPLIVFVTAYDQYALQAFEAAATDYLLKPVQPDRLAACCQRLQALLRQRASTDAPATLDASILPQLRALLGAVPGMPPAVAEPLTVIQASVGNDVDLVPVEEVIYFEAADKYVRVITEAREYLIRLSLRELLPRLDPVRFWQVHRSLVVQVREVAQARRDEQGRVKLSLRRRPETLPVSRIHAARFKGM